MDFFGLFLILTSYILKCSGGTIHSQIRATFPEIRQNYCRVLTLSFETQNLSLPNACLNNLREFFSFSFIGQDEPSSIFRGIKNFVNSGYIWTTYLSPGSGWVSGLILFNIGIRGCNPPIHLFFHPRAKLLKQKSSLLLWFGRNTPVMGVSEAIWGCYEAAKIIGSPYT